VIRDILTWMADRFPRMLLVVAQVAGAEASKAAAEVASSQLAVLQPLARAGSGLVFFSSARWVLLRPVFGGGLCLVFAASLCPGETRHRYTLIVGGDFVASGRPVRIDLGSASDARAIRCHVLRVPPRPTIPLISAGRVHETDTVTTVSLDRCGMPQYYSSRTDPIAVVY